MLSPILVLSFSISSLLITNTGSTENFLKITQNKTDFTEDTLKSLQTLKQAIIYRKKYPKRLYQGINNHKIAFIRKQPSRGALPNTYSQKINKIGGK